METNNPYEKSDFAITWLMRVIFLTVVLQFGGWNWIMNIVHNQDGIHFHQIVIIAVVAITIIHTGFTHKPVLVSKE